MDSKVLNYIDTQRVGVFAIEMLDGSPHAATVHFAYTQDPFEFYIVTDATYRKAEPLLKNKESRASFVIGSSEEDMKTLQLDGVVQLVSANQKGLLEDVYLKKFPEKTEDLKEIQAVFFKFTPAWWRFTDWTTPEGKSIILSE